MRRGWLVASTISAALVAIVACREATSIELIVRTNVPYDGARGIAIAVAVNGAAAETAAPAATVERGWPASGDVGRITLIPAGERDGSVAVRISLSAGRDPATCTARDAVRCIIARRILHFLPHITLHLPVVLYSQCESVGCDEAKTCSRNGTCVSSAVDADVCATPSGCPLAEDPPIDAPVTASPDGAPAPTSDGSSGASSDADAARDSASSEGGSSGFGGVRCATAACVGATPDCCVDFMTCVPRNVSCGGSRYACDGTEDCNAAVGEICCRSTADDTDCRTPLSCMQNGGQIATPAFCLPSVRLVNAAPRRSPPTACASTSRASLI